MGNIHININIGTDNARTGCQVVSGQQFGSGSQNASYFDISSGIIPERKKRDVPYFDISSGIIPEKKSRNLEAAKPSYANQQSEQQFGRTSQNVPYFNISSGIIPERKEKIFEAAKTFLGNGECDENQNEDTDENQYQESYFGDEKAGIRSYDQFVFASKAWMHSCSKLMCPELFMQQNSVQNATPVTCINCWQGLVAMKDKTTTSKPMSRLPVEEAAIGA